MTRGSSLVVRGLIGVVFGILAFAWPGLTITALVYLFGAYALLDGIANIAHGVASGSLGRHGWAMIVQGLIGIAAGIVAFLLPGITMIVLVMVVGIWALLTGIFEVIAAVRLGRAIGAHWLLATSGVLSIVLGFLLFVFPLTGAIVLAWWVAAYAIVAGVALIVLGLRLSRHVAA